MDDFTDSAVGSQITQTTNNPDIFRGIDIPYRNEAIPLQAPPLPPPITSLIEYIARKMPRLAKKTQLATVVEKVVEAVTVMEETKPLLEDLTNKQTKYLKEIREEELPKIRKAIVDKKGAGSAKSANITMDQTAAALQAIQFRQNEFVSRLDQMQTQMLGVLEKLSSTFNESLQMILKVIVQQPGPVVPEGSVSNEFEGSVWPEGSVRPEGSVSDELNASMLPDASGPIGDNLKTSEVPLWEADSVDEPVDESVGNEIVDEPVGDESLAGTYLTNHVVEESVGDYSLLPETAKPPEAVRERKPLDEYFKNLNELANKKKQR